ncbi:hypothetical protein DSO57_1016955 [Entomophthora muscae]|uniref:Uncharacterized protein n=1 Tax=Entomophthora muscae TaxID=34485 RepID=A0ACC2UE99_9FUNG|nr:hypothetical protein DSO57_1016955 [Entomophthora muscae]
MVTVKSLPPLALDRTIFPHRTEKSAQKLAKPLNSLKDLAYTIDERFVLAYPSQVVNNGALDSVPTWEESLINLDYLLTWAQPHLKLIKSKQPGCATAKPSNSNPTGLNADLNHSSYASQSELKPEIIAKPSNLMDKPLQNFSPAQSDPFPGSGDLSKLKPVP